MSSLTNANRVWKIKLGEVLIDYQHEVSPRGMKVRELIGSSYRVEMPAYLSYKQRNVNLGFMFAEAAWIISGSNRLSDITPYMKVYKNFSDDGVFLRGAYGPKVVDQLPYIVDTIVNDNDSRQAVLNIWRERPGPSKDIPCTTQMQFFIRNNLLEAVVTMRSNDIVLGYTYDVFTFSMVSKAVQLLLIERGVHVALGHLQVNVGSLHMYEDYFDKSEGWRHLTNNDVDEKIEQEVSRWTDANTYEELITNLRLGAESNAKKPV